MGKAPNSRQQRIDVVDATLHCEVHGDGPLVICAHGFPDTLRTFRAQLGPLVAAGYRVALLAMRGYAPSSASSDARYDAITLGCDLLAVARELAPGQQVALIGHDWGAVAAYAAAAVRPEQLACVVTAAVPHLRVAGPRFAHPRQLRRSWYMALFQLPWVGERALLHDDMALIDRLWRDWSPDYRCPPEELRAIKDAMRPNSSAVIGYYRAVFSRRALRRETQQVMRTRTTVPALYLHGKNDGCVGAELAVGLAPAYRAGVEVVVLDDCGHFLHLERPDVVNDKLLAFLATHLPADG